MEKGPGSRARTLRRFLLIGLAAGIAWRTAPASAVAAAPRVVVTVKPVHSLVAAVMQGVGVPELLLEGSASPHAYALRPSGAAALAGADVVVWVGAGLETFLSRPLAALAPRALVLELARSGGVTLLPARSGGAWEAHEEHPREPVARAGAAGPARDDGAAPPDVHLWLDPGNAAGIVRVVARELEQADPPHAGRYRENSARALARIAALDAELEHRLAPVRSVPYVVFHDAYQYFERRYGLAPAGAISVSPERSPGARRLTRVRERILRAGVRCVFAEPQFEPRLVATLVEGTRARTGVLDPLGADLPPGPEAWFALMRNLADALAACLAVP